MTSLERQVEALTSELEEKENSLQLAAQIGKQLLQTNHELTAKFDQSSAENMVRIESLEQEIYIRDLKLEQRLHAERDLMEEVESLQKQICRMQEQHDATDTQHDSAERQLAKQMSGMQLELEKAQLTCAQVEQQNADLQSMLDDVRSQLKEALASMQESSPDEISQLLCLLQSVQSEKAELEAQLREVENARERSALELKSVKQSLSRHDEELDEVKSEATSYYNTLLKTREEIKELNMEMELLKMENQERGKKGNSLFSEVEDRRIEAEKELITFKVKYEALLKQHSMTREHLHKLNIQLAGLLQMCGGDADKRHVERLQEQLAKSSAQISEMAAKIRSYENQENIEVDYLKNFTPTNDGDNEARRTEFLVTLLKAKESELCDCRKEAAYQEFLRLAESQKLAKLESRLYYAERQRECLQGELIKMRLKVDELLIKYEPDSLQKPSTPTKEAEVETIPEDIPKAFDTAEDDAESEGGDEQIDADPFMQQMLELETAIKKSRPTPSASKGPSPNKQQRVTFKDVENEEKSENVAASCSQPKARQRVRKCVALKSSNPGECNQQ